MKGRSHAPAFRVRRRLGAAARRPVLLGALGVSAGAAALSGAPAAVAATNYTWSGADSSVPNWSQSDNWSGATGAPSGTIGTLTFPDLGGACDAGTSPAACYAADNDIGPLTAGNLTIDDNSPYVIGSSDPSYALTLDPSSGDGVDATASPAGAGGPAEIGVPVVLGDSQTWKIDGGGQSGAGVYVPQLSGSGNLNLDLNDFGTLYLNQLDISGTLLPTGDGSGFVALAGTGARVTNGIDLDGGTSFIDLAPGATSGAITPDTNNGPDGYLFAVGADGAPDATLTVSGWEDFGPATELSFDIDDNGSTPSTDFSQLVADGGVTFDGTLITLNQGTTASGGCAKLTPGASYPVITTPASLTQSIAYINAQGTTGILEPGQTSAPIALSDCTDGSTTVSSQATLTYASDAIIATVTSSSTNTPTTPTPTTPSPAPTTGSTLPSQSQVHSALSAIGHPAGNRAIRALLKAGRFNTSFTAPSGGALKVVWSTTVTTGKGRHRKHRTVTLASGSAAAGSSPSVHLTIHLTRAGRTLLEKKHSGVPTTATERFRPAGGSWITVKKRFSL